MPMIGGPPWVQWARGTSPQRQILWEATFSGHPAGKLVTLPSGLLLTRASVATVQTGTSTVDSTPGVNEGRIGRKLDADALGLVIEEARENVLRRSRSMTTQPPWSAESGGTTQTADYAAGPDGSVLADRVQVPGSPDYSAYQSVGVLAAHVTSLWSRAVTAPDNARVGYDVGGSTFSTIAVGSAWQRNALIAAGGGAASFLTPDQPDVAAGAADNLHDLMQVELGKFATEAIVTAGAATTRAGDRLYLADSATVLDGGRLSMEWRMRPKASAADLASTVGTSSLFFITGGVDEEAFLRNAPLRFDVLVGGVNKNSGATVFSWAIDDVVDIWLEAGNGPTLMRIRVNMGAATTLIDDATALGSYPTGVVFDFLQSGAGTSVFSSWVESIRAYKAGFRPGWAS